MAPARIARRIPLAALLAACLLAFLASSCGAVRRHINALGSLCDKFASPTGSDRAGGDFRHPFRTLRRLDLALGPGQTGCLRGGTYGSITSWHPLYRSGMPEARITIRSYPGERAKIIGWTQVIGSYTTLAWLEIDGSNTLFKGGSSNGSCPRPGVSQGLSLEGEGDVFEHNNLYQSMPKLRGNGIGIGWSGSGDNTVIRFNRIHDVGHCKDFDHLIYLAHGSNVQIYDNWLWHDPHGWGVQIYPDVQGARVFSNVIDGAGSGFTIGGDAATSNNQIYHNVILNSTGLREAKLSGVAISDYWASAAGSNNVFAANDSYRNRGGTASVRALRLIHNVRVNPRFRNSGAHDYRLRRSSPLSSWGLWSG